MEKIIAVVNAAPAKYGIHVQYTTLSQYTAVLNAENRAGTLALPLKEDVDFEYAC